MFTAHSQELPVTNPPVIDIKTVFKHLLYAWSAEYALRLTPLVSDQEHLDHQLRWTFPQVYYAGLYSARALLEASGIPNKEAEYVAAIMSGMAKLGLYAEEGNLYHEILAYRIPNCNKNLIKGQDVRTFHAGLVDLADRVAMHHERFIIQLVGQATFMENVYQLPAYLRDSFLSARLERIFLEVPLS